MSIDIRMSLEALCKTGKVEFSQVPNMEPERLQEYLDRKASGDWDSNDEEMLKWAQRSELCAKVGEYPAYREVFLYEGFAQFSCGSGSDFRRFIGEFCTAHSINFEEF